jgi:TRAP-type mannitol/chloroaromatic compound transport system permease large subunit
MIDVKLQTSFLPSPFGFSLIYLRGVVSDEVKNNDIYLGVLPFIALQLLALFIFWTFPDIISWLPNLIS